jgi:hypothetical protein
MTRRLLMLPGFAAMSAIIALGACSSGPTVSPGAGSTSAVTSLAPGESPGIPVSGPSVAASADPVLGARFPTTIAGQPVTNVQTFHFLDYLTSTGTPKTIIDRFNVSASAAGINPRSVNLGTARVTISGKSVLLQALRAPGSDASQFTQPLVAVAQQRDIGAGATARAIALAPSNVGGKSVQVASSADLTQYYYPTGDTVFILNNVDAATAATLLAALP